VLKAIRLYNIKILLSLALTAFQSVGTVAAQKEREYAAFSNPERTGNLPLNPKKRHTTI
jgi:hypothetical protein